MSEYRDATYSMVVVLHGFALGLTILAFLYTYDASVNMDRVKIAMKIFAFFTLFSVLATGWLFIYGWGDSRI